MLDLVSLEHKYITKGHNYTYFFASYIQSDSLVVENEKVDWYEYRKTYSIKYTLLFDENIEREIMENHEREYINMIKNTLKYVTESNFELIRQQKTAQITKIILIYVSKYYLNDYLSSIFKHIKSITKSVKTIDDKGYNYNISVKSFQSSTYKLMKKLNIV